MAIPALLKSPYVLGSAGVVGVGWVSVVATSGNGTDYSGLIETNAKSRNEFIKNLSSSNALDTRCFSKFFGENNTVTFTDSASPNVSFSAPERPTVSDPLGTAQGCTSIQFSHKNYEAFMFQTETSVKNDKVGLSLFSVGRSFKTTSAKGLTLNDKENNIIQYYLLFLEKTDSKNWTVKGGYSWMDDKFSGGFKTTTLHLKSPNNNININAKFSGLVGDTEYKDGEWQHNMYLGHWTETNNQSGKGVFEDIELWGNDKNNAEILGKDYTSTFADVKGNRGYTKTAVSRFEYKVEEKKWHQRLLELKAETLDNWYAPFKDKKGVWEENKNLS